MQKKISRLWKVLKHEMDKASKEAVVALKKGQDYIKDVSSKAEDNLEAMTLSLKRQKAYYRLGKCLANLPKKKWPGDKKAGMLLKKISGINNRLRKVKARLKKNGQKD